jgi:hypothetical protein
MPHFRNNAIHSLLESHALAVVYPRFFSTDLHEFIGKVTMPVPSNDDADIPHVYDVSLGYNAEPWLPP